LAGLEVYSCQDILEKATELFINVSENQFEFLVKAALGIARC